MTQKQLFEKTALIEVLRKDKNRLQLGLNSLNNQIDALMKTRGELEAQSESSNRSLISLSRELGVTQIDDY